MQDPKCKEFEKRIPDFIKRNMDYRELYEFREHLDTCEKCKEELSIQFLIEEGILHLESGEAFDSQKELQKRIYSADKSLRRYEGLRTAWNMIFVTGSIFLGILLIFYLG